MTKSGRLRGTLLMLCMGSGAAHAGTELVVAAKLEPVTTGVMPSVKLEPASASLTRGTGGQWRYVLTDDKRIVASVTASLDSLPKDYVSAPLTVNLPFDLESPMTISVYGVAPGSGDSAEASYLFRQPVTMKEGVSPEDLFRWFQRASAEAGKRLSKLETGSRMGFYDSQVLYKLLQIARELGQEQYLVPDETVGRARAALLASLKDKDDSRVLVKAIPAGLSDVDLLLRQVDEIEAVQLAKIFNRIKSFESKPGESPESCVRYNAFWRSLMQHDSAKRTRWENTYHLQALAVNARTLCASRAIAQVRTEMGTVSAAEGQAIVEKFSVPPAVAVVAKTKPQSPLAAAVENNARALRPLSRLAF